jgi:hypothetical protein
LLVQVDHLTTVIEFKYYLQRRAYGLQGEPLRFKGGPGPQNEAEFNACVQKLRSAALPDSADRRLVLIYERESTSRSRHSFHQSYGDLAVG